MTEGSQKVPGRVNAGYLGICVSWVFAQIVVPTRLSMSAQARDPSRAAARGRKYRPSAWA